jgi:predicted metal-dependent peptidase
MTSVALQDPLVTYYINIDDIMRRVAKAKSLLILDHPFFGMAVSKRPIIYTETVSTAAMAATGQMYINPAWCTELNLTVRNLMFLLAHEALHYMLCHSLRIGHRLHTAWNVACDKVINDTLVDAGVGDPIEGGIYMRDARNYAAEELYDENDADGPGPGGIGNDIGSPCDEGGQALDESQIHQLEAQAKIEAIQSAKAAKAVGKLPSSIERLVDQLVNVSTPWHEILERFMSSKIRDGKSWSTPNRKFISQGIYLKGKSNLPKMGEIVIGVDTSGSIGQSELDMFNAHINRILHTCNPEKVTVIYCDARVNSTVEYEPDDFPVTLKLQGGGGTSFTPVFDYIDDNGIEPEVVVYLTDGYGDQNNFTTTHETVWLTTHSEDFDWGTVIKFEE